MPRLLSKRLADYDFCSELVWAAYHGAGAATNSYNGKAPNPGPRAGLTRRSP